MADIRIKDLTTTASSTASDDFFAADGTTNGTRKLSAYSPSFGGNATVGGTLTVSGNTTLSGNLDVASGISTGVAQIQVGNGRTGSGYAYIDLVGDTTYSDYGSRFIRGNGGANAITEIGHRGTGDFALVANDAAPIKFYTNGVTAATIAATTGNTTIHSTSASTTTSSGALVVGNGTSGGLGVGGNIYAGGNLALTGTGALIATSSADSMARIGFGLFSLEQGVAIGLSRRLNYGDALIGRNLQGQSGSDSYITSATTPGSGYGAFEIQHGGVARILVGSGATTANAVVTPTVAASFTTTTAAVSTVLQVINTTASTSTSTGALVVSGGVGVAKELYVGSKLTVTNSNASALLADFASAYAGGAASPYLVVGSYTDPSTTGVRIVADTDYSNNNQAAIRLQTRNASGTLQTALTLDRDGNLIQKVNGTAPTLSANSSMTFELTSNTTLKVFVRGTDGTTRSVSLTLA